MSVSDELTLTYMGGMAEGGALVLSEYAVSLQGWRDLFQVLGQLYLHSISPDLKSVHGNDLLRIDVRGERAGSYQTILVFIFGAIAGGILGNRADAGVVWSFKRLVEWYRKVVSNHVQTKSRTTNVEEVVASLEALLAEAGVAVGNDSNVDPSVTLFAESKADEMEDHADESQVDVVNKVRVLVEVIDDSLKRATRPMVQSCERIKVSTPDIPQLFEMGAADRAVIAAPLTLPPPKREWRKARVVFDRINRKTGRALFNFEDELGKNVAAHYSRIIDPTVRRPHNVYTIAFDENVPVDVWIRQVSPERGKLHFQWEIRSDNPEQGLLFNLPPQD